MATLRIKMRVVEVSHIKNEDGTTRQEQLKLMAVTGSGAEKNPENAQWAKWTPNANLTIYIDNPDAIGLVSSGHTFFVDLTPAEEPAAAATPA
jgi:hypothetical protein